MRQAEFRAADGEDILASRDRQKSRYPGQGSGSGRTAYRFFARLAVRLAFADDLAFFFTFFRAFIDFAMPPPC